MPLATKAYFIDGFLVRWSGSTLQLSIYLNERFKFRRSGSLLKGTSCVYSLVAFLITHEVAYYLPGIFNVV